MPCSRLSGATLPNGQFPTVDPGPDDLCPAAENREVTVATGVNRS